MKRFLLYTSLYVIIASFSFGCRAISQGKRFAECDFRIASVKSVNLAGVNVEGIRDFTEFNLIDAGKIALSLTQGSIPFGFTLNLEVKNPNNKVAALNRLDWIMYVDDIEMARGTSNERVEVAPAGIGTLPLSFQLDLKKVFSGGSAKALFNLILNLVNLGADESQLVFKVKPSFLILGSEVAYPGYIKIKKEFGGE
ncbi:MAG TPA: hypothetical protein DCM08_04060 [Microscillaceae bacterium]|nr:hypothetical protein [Microscillaceae bacterium]